MRTPLLPLFLRPRFSSSTFSSSTFNWESLLPPIVISRSAMLDLTRVMAHPGTAALWQTYSDWFRNIDQSEKWIEKVSNKSQKSLRVFLNGWPWMGGRGFTDFSGLIEDFARKMTEGIADCMPLALRSVGDAIRLDSENRTKVRLSPCEFVFGWSRTISETT